MTQPRVVLVGGAPFCGKSSAAIALGEMLGRAVVSTDDLGIAARSLISTDAMPELHAYACSDHRLYYSATPVTTQLEHGRRAHTALWPAIEAVVSAHDAWAPPAIIEGWALLPELVASSFPERAVWLSVPQDVLLARARAAKEFWEGASDPDLMLANFVDRSVRFTAHIRTGCQARGLHFLQLVGSETPADVAQQVLSLLAKPAAAS